jgi:hypothetical protein
MGCTFSAKRMAGQTLLLTLLTPRRVNAPTLGVVLQPDQSALNNLQVVEALGQRVRCQFEAQDSPVHPTFINTRHQHPTLSSLLPTQVGPHAPLASHSWWWRPFPRRRGTPPTWPGARPCRLQGQQARWVDRRQQRRATQPRRRAAAAPAAAAAVRPQQDEIGPLKPKISASLFAFLLLIVVSTRCLSRATLRLHEIAGK